jgi:NAD(P)-dependent dehydrogenase (short-subunit alcohol dehydrogenase family)
MLELDVRSQASVEHCVAEILARAGRIDVLVNNAGVMHMDFAEETRIEDARAIFETNFFGVVRMTDAVLPHMRSRRQGRIINVGSLSAWVGEPGEAFYSASKRARAGYTVSFRKACVRKKGLLIWEAGYQLFRGSPGNSRASRPQGSSLSPTHVSAVR